MNPKNKWKARWAIIVLLCTTFIAGGVLWLAGEGAALAATSTILDGSVKLASPNSVSPGGNVIYSIVLTNGSLVSNTGQVIVTDKMPVEITSIMEVQVYPSGKAL
ncbi:MAG: hypothetical protein P1S60_03885, partial [Anaerolineae bacterium]|nr:hypothetical protein [Anaerolineae bacterium]